MNNQKKNIIYSLVLVAVVAVVWLYRDAASQSDGGEGYITLRGRTMGTSYNIKYEDAQERNFQSGVDSLLEVFNQSVNHYLPESEISQFNRQDTLSFRSPYFYPVLKRSDEIYQSTNGAFDPTVAPLVNAWGFGPDGGILPDSVNIDSLLQLVGFDKIKYTTQYVTKTKPSVQLNFSAIAKGYGVDVVADYLRKKGIDNLMVEIGGEVSCHGKNPEGELWKIGIDNPSLPGSMSATITLNNQAMATSGNYLNYYERDGKRYAHTIDPQTGYPVQHSVLSASVIAPDCMTADGYATAFMVMGLEEAQKVLANNPSLDAYLIYDADGSNICTFATTNLQQAITNL